MPVLFNNGPMQTLGTFLANQIPTLLMRRGGNASNWSTGGGNNYTPDQVRMQVGAVVVSIASGNSGSVAVTFPVAFANAPIVLISLTSPSGQPATLWYASSITASGFVAHILTAASGASSYTVTWIALGDL